jgi:hypothetical protein
MTDWTALTDSNVKKKTQIRTGPDGINCDEPMTLDYISCVHLGRSWRRREE